MNLRRLKNMGEIKVSGRAMGVLHGKARSETTEGLVKGRLAPRECVCGVAAAEIPTASERNCARGL